MSGKISNNYSVRLFSPKIITFLMTFILLFYLLQLVQSAGIGPSGGGVDDSLAGLGDSPAGFGNEDVYALEVNLIMKEEVEPYVYPIREQLVEVFWDMKDLESQEMQEFSVSATTDENGKAIFELFPGTYILRVDYQGTSKNETVIVNPNIENKIDWIISRYVIPTYNLEIRDKNGGIVYPKEIIKIIYEGPPQLTDPSNIQLLSDKSTTNKILNFEILSVINRGKVSIIEISPKESFLIANFTPEDPPQTIIYSINIDKSRS